MSVSDNVPGSSRISRSRRRYLRIVELAGVAEVQRLVESGAIPPSVGAAICRLPAEQQRSLAARGINVLWQTARKIRAERRQAGAT